jgi:dTDP-4-dehydrorhamnose 3,5-epimerase
MLFRPLDVAGLYLIEPERLKDERGYFARIFSNDAFIERGLCADYPQWSVSYNRERGTLRGLHFQAAPHGEIKLVSCSRGAVFDVAVDLRVKSQTYGKWIGVELSADNGAALYIPEGFAHGFQTLADDTEVLYHISQHYRPETSRGVRWDDPDLAVAWPPADRRVISERDHALPSLREL